MKAPVVNVIAYFDIIDLTATRVEIKLTKISKLSSHPITVQYITLS